MSRQTEIAAAIANARDFLTKHPDEARYRDSAATAVVEDGLKVRVSGPDGSTVMTDMVKGIGGTDSAPSPGWLFRAAYASCVATLIAMRAAESGIRLSQLEVVADSESDDRGILGIDDAAPVGPISARLVVRARGDDADDQTIRDIVQWGIDHCPIDDAIRRSVPVDVVLDTYPGTRRPG